MGCSQNHGPVLGIEYIAAPNMYGYQNGTLILGNTPITTSDLLQHLFVTSN